MDIWTWVPIREYICDYIKVRPNVSLKRILVTPSPILENQMEKSVQDEIEAGFT